MFVTECSAEFRGHRIAARNAWGLAFSLKALTGENRLYIDGKVVDTNAEILALSATPIMRGNLQVGSDVHVVEVFARSGLLRVKLRIHIDGEKIAGEDF